MKQNLFWSKSRKSSFFFDLTFFNFHTILNEKYRKISRIFENFENFHSKFYEKLRSKKSKIFDLDQKLFLTSTKINFASFFMKSVKISFKSYSLIERVTLSTILETFAER